MVSVDKHNEFNQISMMPWWHDNLLKFCQRLLKENPSLLRDLLES